MASFWQYALAHEWPICRRTIFALPTDAQQLQRERRNARLAVLPAVLLGLGLTAGLFGATGWTASAWTAVATTIWAEVWHYASHRAMHLPALHAIDREHHRSHLSTPYTASSFSLEQKLVFDIGLLAPLAAVDTQVPSSVYGIVAWYIGFLIINAYSHANFEITSPAFNRGAGRVLATTTFHALHHARSTGNHGLGTRVLDRLFRTEWDDYEPVYDRIVGEARPLERLGERVGSHRSPPGRRALVAGMSVFIARSPKYKTGRPRQAEHALRIYFVNFRHRTD
ncbi:MAG: sterol desaturase family protein [Vicinamibacterales bacterium]